MAEFNPVTAAIKTLDDKDLTWEGVADRLIEESKSIRATSGRAATDAAVCSLCSKDGH